MTLGSRIAELRVERGMTHEALARAVGRRCRAVAAWQGADGDFPRPEQLQRLADLFFPGIDPEKRLAELFRGVRVGLAP